MCAVLSMHVPNLGIHTLWHFCCASRQFPLYSPQVKKRVLARDSVKVWLFQTLGFVLRRAVAGHFALFLLQETKEAVHNTQDALIA